MPRKRKFRPLTPYRLACQKLYKKLLPRLEEVDCTWALNTVCFSNHPSFNLPYHNLHHALCVAWNCTEFVRKHPRNINKRTSRVLYTAALFHDYGHSGGIAIDSVNVQFAIQEFSRLYIQDHGDSEREIQFVKDVSGLIQVTQYENNAFTYEPKNMAEKVLRDADLLQILEPNWLDQVVGGLIAEFARGGKFITWEQMIEGQVKWWNSGIPQMHTKWGQSQFGGIRNKLLKLQWSSEIDRSQFRHAGEQPKETAA